MREAVITTFGPDHAEKRHFCRMSVTAELTYLLPGENTLYKGLCNNLSHSGIQFITEKLLEAGQRLEVTIDTKSAKFKPMAVIVEVVRVEPSESNTYRISGTITEYR
ncbi:MAG: PilZ domain-containing protein [Nitrospiraceae bacterium]|nr:MAG: PilZ domain-containing protein [Nitrospiraceae bacterium]